MRRFWLLLLIPALLAGCNADVNSGTITKKTHTSQPGYYTFQQLPSGTHSAVWNNPSEKWTITLRSCNKSKCQQQDHDVSHAEYDTLHVGQHYKVGK